MGHLDLRNELLAQRLGHATLSWVPHNSRAKRRTAGKLATTTAMVAALGVVFGDIGTSPLYAMGLLFDPESPHALAVEPGNVLGSLSVIFWLVTLVVTVKYAWLIMSADNNGEGGVIALFTLLREKLVGKRIVMAVTIVGLIGVSLFLGDAVITPAISVLSAVEGLKTAEPHLGTLVVPVVIAILAAIFALQRFGTARIGKLFGPAMVLWFGMLAVLGVIQIGHHPQVLAALSPTFAVSFIVHHPLMFFAALSIMLLTVTGVEALVADMGHFGRAPIRRAWLYVTFPALMLNYFGQGAMLLSRPSPPPNLFFAMVGPELVLPLVIAATVATVIAAQAVLSGAFSLAAQATKLALLPRLRLRYPSGVHGQVYVAAVNWALFVVVVIVVLTFESSVALADAYGLAVVGCMLASTLLFFGVVHRVWGRPMWQVLLGVGVFVTIDVALLLACLPKLLTGGWITLLLAAAIFLLLWVWQLGTSFVSHARTAREGSLEEFITHVNRDNVRRVPTTAIYLHQNAATVPVSMRATEERLGVLHDHALLVSVVTADLPHIAAGDRILIDDLGYSDGIWQVTITYGFNDMPNVPADLALAVQDFPQILAEATLDEATYYVSRLEIGYAHIPGLPGMWGRVFKFMKRSAADPVKFFKLPLDRTFTVSAHIN